MAQQQFNTVGILWRIAFSLALVFLTFNPSGHSYFHWVRDSLPHIQPVSAIAGVVLLGAWLFFVRSTLTSLGAVGVLLLLAFFASIVWWIVSKGWLSLTDQTAVAWIVLTMLGLVLGIGMSWAHNRQRISGQASVDRVDNN